MRYQHKRFNIKEIPAMSACFLKITCAIVFSNDNFLISRFESVADSGVQMKEKSPFLHVLLLYMGNKWLDPPIYDVHMFMG